ncbi:MAG TPA: ABC transporter ATP-binding protein [Acidimicrobiales bacterium]
MTKSPATGTNAATGVDLLELSVSYGERLVVSAVSLRVMPGEWLGLIGPNGAGKSSLLRAVAGLVAHRGTVRVGLSEDQPTRRRLSQLVAFLPQRPELPPTMTVGDYILLGRSPYIPLFGNERGPDHRAADAVVTRLGLAPFADRRLGELSGGEAQRVVLARALTQGAPVLLLDEPSAALDLGEGQRVLELVDELRRERGLTVISAMHDLGIIGQFADRLAVLVAGNLTQVGLAKEVLTTAAIERHFGASVQLADDGYGGIVVVPVRRRPTSMSPLGPRRDRNEEPIY